MYTKSTLGLLKVHQGILKVHLGILKIHIPNIRFVGWLKTFIHNRSLATENLVRGYNTSSIIRHMPDEITNALQERLAKGAGWMEKASNELLRMKLVPPPAQRRGYGGVVLLKSRRNTKKKVTNREVTLYNHLLSRIRRNLMPSGSLPKHVDVMEWGVHVNGRDWKAGQFCQYTRDTRAGSKLLLMGTIVKYYTFIGSGKVPVFVFVNSHVIREQKGVMFIVEAAHHAQHVVHIDSLSFLFHMAPHYNDNKADLKCALPVAPAYPEVLAIDMQD